MTDYPHDRTLAGLAHDAAFAWSSREWRIFRFMVRAGGVRFAVKSARAPYWAQ